MRENKTQQMVLILACFLVVCLVLMSSGTALADNGPHGGFTPTTDGCASCHRTHTAQAPNLLLESAPDLCITCHGSSGTGADTNVLDGVYLERDDASESPPEGIVDRGLKGGGFINTIMNTGFVTTTVGSALTSSWHLYDGSIGTLWGNDSISGSPDPGPAGFAISCTNCHNPHGGGTYRILRPIPSDSGAGSDVIVSDEIDKIYTVSDENNQYWGEAYGNAVPLAQWCSQCHTRYLADSGSGHVDSGDAIFTYRHTSDSTSVSCFNCHVAHGSSASMGPASGSVEWPDGASSPSGDFRSSLLRINNRGVCESCHAGGAGAGCTGCHAGTQGNRREVVTEFPTADPNAHFGGELDDADCEVCHDQSAHMDGYVDLFDPDGGANYRFQQPSDLVSDPDLSNFCAGCHDPDGATRLANPFDPFGDGNASPDVETRFQGTLQWNEWYGDTCFGEEGTLRAVNSHHDISDDDQTFSGAKVECLNCHGAHNAGSTQPVADPRNTILTWSGTDNNFCLVCHNGGTGPLDPGFPDGVAGPGVAMRGIDSCGYTEEPWWVSYKWEYTAHGEDSKRSWPGYPGVDASGNGGAPHAELNCMDCHDPHGSYTPANSLGNPYMIADAVDGTMYIDDGSRTGTWYGPPWETTGVARSPVVVSISGVTVDWGSSNSLCSACHADWTAAYSWHEYDCTGCQTCHGHGQDWQNYDWANSGANDTSCQDLADQGAQQTLTLLEAADFVHPAFKPQLNICQNCHTAHSP